MELGPQDRHAISRPVWCLHLILGDYFLFLLGFVIEKLVNNLKYLNALAAFNQSCWNAITRIIVSTSLLFEMVGKGAYWSVDLFPGKCTRCCLTLLKKEHPGLLNMPDLTEWYYVWYNAIRKLDLQGLIISGASFAFAIHQLMFLSQMKNGFLRTSPHTHNKAQREMRKLEGFKIARHWSILLLYIYCAYNYFNVWLCKLHGGPHLGAENWV